MKQVLHNFINDSKKTGLYLLPFPTGFGKTYEVIHYIAEQYKSLGENQRIFFLTTTHKNLPVEDLEDIIGQEESQKNVIKIESYRDSILHNFSMDKIPDEYKGCEAVKKLYKAIEGYNYAKEIKHSGLLEYVEQKEKNLDEAEKGFRTFIYNDIVKPLKNVVGKNKEKTEISEILYSMLKNDNSFKWIGEIYPNIFVKDYKVVFMTIKKFLTVNYSFYEDMYTFAEGTISDNALIFIDEFDATKNDITDSIIDQSLKNSNDYLDFIERIVTKFVNYEKELPTIVNDSMLSNPSEFNYLLKLAQEIYDKHKIYKKYYCEAAAGRNFLFNDFTYHALFMDSNKKGAVIYENENNNNMTIELIDSSNREELSKKEISNLFTVIRSFNYFLRRFRVFIKDIAPIYTKTNNLKKNPANHITDEQGILSLLNCFGLTEQESKFVKDGMTYETARKKRMQNEFVKTNKFYDRGIKTFEFTNKSTKNETTSFNYIEIDSTAESFIANLSLKAKVVGISATARINSVLSNYSLSYLQNVLEDNFHHISESDFQYIKDLYAVLTKKYKTNDDPIGEIEVVLDYVDDSLFNDNKDLYSSLNKIFISEKYQRKMRKFLIGNVENDAYKLQRYLSIAYVFKQFVTNSELKSFLCFTKGTPKPNSDLDLNVIQKICELIIEEHDIHINDNYLVVLKSGDAFKTEKEQLISRLEAGEKIFVMTAYATLGAGQNLVYKPSKYDVDLINLTDFANMKDDRNFKKDFDGIYLGEITNVITNLYREEEQFSNKSLYKYVVELENLYENDEISYGMLHLGIQQGFKKLINPQDKYGLFRREQLFKSKIGYISKEVIQAVGRLNRTFNKRKKIYVYFSSSIFDFFDTDLLEKEVLSPEVTQLATFIKTKRSTKLLYGENNYQAERVSSLAKSFIHEKLSKMWTNESIKFWVTLRDYVLKYPTVNEKMYKGDLIFREYYIRLDSKRNQYFFMDISDFSNVKISFDKNKTDAYRNLVENEELFEESVVKECSDSNARLNEVLKYPGMKEYFKEQGYALSFKENEYMFSPVVYQSIYKGALGEVAGKFILETTLGTSLSELNSDIFERFDYELCNGIFIDFKHWRKNSVSADEYINKSLTKLDSIGGKKAYIINLLNDSNSKNQISASCDGRIIEVPYLIDKDTHEANYKIIEMLREDLLNEK